MKKPRLNFSTVLLQSLNELCCRLLRVLANWVNGLASFEVGYVSTETPPQLNPLGPQIIKGVHDSSCELGATITAIIPGKRVTRYASVPMRRAGSPPGTAGEPSRNHTDSRNVIGWLANGWKRNDATLKALCEEIDALVAKRGSAGAVSFHHAWAPWRRAQRAC